MQVGQINFTKRETDILSCILNSRGCKKIAYILLISPRTVETHIQTILTKIGGNSQEAIIDFIEKSGQLKVIKSHYLSLLTFTLFEQHLKQISYLTKKDKLCCSIFYNERELKDPILQKLLKHLKLAGLKVEEKVNAYGSQNLKDMGSYNLYFLSEVNIDFLLTGSSFEKTNKNIFLIKDAITQTLVLKRSVINNARENIINLYSEEEYFQNFFCILKKVLVGFDIVKFLDEFEQLKDSVTASRGDGVIEYLSKDKSGTSLNHDNAVTFSQGNNLFRIKNNNKIIILAILFCLFIGSISLLYLFSQAKKANIIEINKEFAEFVNNYSYENIGVTEGLKPNLDPLIKIDNTVSNLDHQDMLQYFKNNKASKEELLNYLCGLHAIAMNSLYNKYNELKARKLLNNAKDSIEGYVINRGNNNIDFDELSPEEIYIELEIIDSLPEMYAKILYLLGRTYTYFEEYNRSNDFVLPVSIEDFQKYYEVSAYLGNKLNLFEGFLSIRNGIEMARLFSIKSDIKKGNHQQAREKILESLNILEKLRLDNTEYITDYKPGNTKPKTIIPANDNYCQLFILEQIMNHYSRLIKITEDKNQKLFYANEMLSYFFNNNGKAGIFEKLEKVPDKKVACLYNSLGYALLQLAQEEINFKDFKDKSKEKLNLTADNDLEFVIQLFNLALTKSRNSHYPKGDSYDGLIASYTSMLKRETMSKLEIEDLKTLIDKLKQKREKLKYSAR